MWMVLHLMNMLERIIRMSKIYFTSDLHFGHDREFIYKPRGFENVEDMNKTILKNYKRIVTDEDTIYILGDLMLGDNEAGIAMLRELPGHKKIILGNHDTATRIELYKTIPNTEILGYATVIKYRKMSFYLSHYPTMTSNMEADANLHNHVTNIYGHTHQMTNFYNDMPFMYHVGVDSHDCEPIEIEKIIEDIKNKIKECYEQL